MVVRGYNEECAIVSSTYNPVLFIITEGPYAYT